MYLFINERICRANLAAAMPLYIYKVTTNWTYLQCAEDANITNINMSLH